MKTTGPPPNEAPASVGWRIQFRFAVHGFCLTWLALDLRDLESAQRYAAETLLAH